ncbi:hypothetical protein AgCh_010380 [Apium graveolens]
MEILRKSFKSTSDSPPQSEEERQILLQQQQQENSMSNNINKDVVVKVTGETELTATNSGQSPANKVWRDSSYDFTNDASNDFDFHTDSPASQPSPLSRIVESPVNAQPRAAFNENLRRRSRVGGNGNGSDEVVTCSSNASFRRKSSLLRVKTKSRLLDAPEMDGRSQRMVKSGVIGKGSEFDEDDPFLEDDLPEEYKKMKFSKWSFLQFFSLILIIAALVCSLTINFFKKKHLFGLELWKWYLMVLVLICGRLVSGWGIRVVVFFVERNFMLRKRVLYFVYGLRNAVQNCIWLAMVLIAWQLIFDKRVEKATDRKILPYVTRVWVCLLVGTLIWLVKTLLVKVLASSFHVSTFFDRIQESLFNQYVIQTLSGQPLVEIQQEKEEEERVMVEVQKFQSAGASMPAELKATIFPKSGKVIGTATNTPRKSSVTGKSPGFSTNFNKKEDEAITIDHLHRLNQKNISAWNMKRLMNIIRKGTLSTLDEQLQASTDEDESEVQITSEYQAKAAAKKIFSNVAKPGSKYIYEEDLMRFMQEDEAFKTIRLFEGASEGKGISRRALKNWVVNAFRERRALALSLNDTKTALLLVVFVFGNTCKTTFEAIIFLFVMHPFDVGDRCEVDGVQMVVEEMNILTTIFLRYDNQKIIYPNSVLATKFISNFYRSPDMGDAIDFCIHISTSAEKIATMKERITRFIENKSEHWYPAPLIVLRDLDDMNRLKISIWLSHRMNFQDMGERWVRRALLVEEIIKVCRELDIEYRMLPVDVNVRNMPAVTSTRVPSNWVACAS